MYSNFIMVVPNDIKAYPDIGKFEGTKTSYFQMPKGSELCIKGVIPTKNSILDIKTDKPELNEKIHVRAKQQGKENIIELKHGQVIAMDENELFFGIINVPEDMRVFAIGARY